MISFAYLTCWSPSSCKIITSDIPLTTFCKVFFFYKPKKEILLRRSEISQQRKFLKSLKTYHVSSIIYFCRSFPLSGCEMICPKDSLSFCVFNTKKDRKDQERYILKNGGRPALELDTSINNALPRSRIGIFMQGKREIFIAFFLVLSYFRK